MKKDFFFLGRDKIKNGFKDESDIILVVEAFGNTSHL